FELALEKAEGRRLLHRRTRVRRQSALYVAAFLRRRHSLEAGTGEVPPKRVDFPPYLLRRASNLGYGHAPYQRCLVRDAILQLQAKRRPGFHAIGGFKSDEYRARGYGGRHPPAPHPPTSMS